METLTIIGAIAAVAIAGVISFVLHSYSSETYDYPPFNLVTIGISFVCALLIAVGVYLWLGAGFTANTLVVLGCGILVYVGLLVFVALRSNILIAIWTVTILSALSAVVVPALFIVRFIEQRLRVGDELDAREERRDEPGRENQDLEGEPCPRPDCSGTLTLRRRVQSGPGVGGSFWGCTNYRRGCTYTQPLWR